MYRFHIMDSVDYLEVKHLGFTLLFSFLFALSWRQGELKDSEALILHWVPHAYKHHYQHLAVVWQSNKSQQCSSCYWLQNGVATWCEALTWYSFTLPARVNSRSFWQVNFLLADFMPAQVSLCWAPARSGIVCTPVPGTWPEQDWCWPCILSSGSFSSSLITCLGLIPMKFVLLGDPAMHRRGFSDCGAAVTHRSCTGCCPVWITFVGLFLQFVLLGHWLAIGLISKRLGAVDFFCLQMSCVQISCRASQWTWRISVEWGERGGISQACHGRDSLSGGSGIPHKKAESSRHQAMCEGNVAQKCLSDCCITHNWHSYKQVLQVILKEC